MLKRFSFELFSSQCDCETVFFLITAAQGSVPSDDLPEFFSYELCTYPASLFERKNMLRESQKASLGADLTKGVSSSELQQDHLDIQYVVDGGHLIQKTELASGKNIW
jgi:hypothetical protein